MMYCELNLIHIWPRYRPKQKNPDLPCRYCTTRCNALILYFSLSENIQSVTERLVGPFDIEDVVDPIGVSISEGIMNFQNSGYEITGKVFQDCGTPRLQKRQASW